MAMVAPGGQLGSVTCSLLRGENGGQLAAALAAAPGWTRGADHVFTPLSGGDGFYLGLIGRPD